MSGATTPTTPTRGTRRTVATFGTYVEAQRAVDQLSDDGFAVEHLSIVSEGLRMVEDVTGRRNFGRAALQGAATGAIIGAILGFLFGLFSVMDPLVSGFVLALWWLVLGAIAGALVGLLSHWMTGGRRDFSSRGRLEASAYHVVADGTVADDAAQRLARLVAEPGADTTAR